MKIKDIPEKTKVAIKLHACPESGCHNCALDVVGKEAGLRFCASLEIFIESRQSYKLDMRKVNKHLRKKT